MIRRPPRSTQSRSSAASDVYKRQEQSRRLRIVDYDDVVAVLQQQRVVEDPLEVRALHLRRPLDVSTLECVVDLLGYGEELVAAVQDLPFGVDADAAEQRHVGGQQLRDTAAVGGGAHVQDPRALERRRGLS